MKRTPGKSWMLAYCGMASALCIAVMLLGTALPILLFIAPAVAGFLIAAVREECGSRMALTAYAAVSLLSLLLVPDREVALAFAALLGYYPLVKPRFDRIRPAIVQLLAKLCLCNLAVLAIYGLLLALLTGRRLWSRELWLRQKLRWLLPPWYWAMWPLCCTIRRC